VLIRPQVVSRTEISSVGKTVGLKGHMVRTEAYTGVTGPSEELILT